LSCIKFLYMVETFSRLYFVMLNYLSTLI
jgi:hypothetical protein